MRLRSFFNLNLRFSDPKMEAEYAIIKGQNILQDHQVLFCHVFLLLVKATMAFLLIMCVLLMIPPLISGPSPDLYIGSGSLVIVIIALVIQKCCKRYLQYITLLLLLAYNLSRLLLVSNNYLTAIRGILFFNGYGIGAIHFIILSRLHKTQYKIIGGFVGWAIRLSIIMGVTDSKTFQPIIFVRQIVIDAFMVFMFYTNEKNERQVFQNFYENREELMKFKELLADSLPQSVIVLETKSQGALFSNNTFKSTFDYQKEELKQESPDLVLKDYNRLPSSIGKPNLSFLHVDTNTIRDSESFDGNLSGVFSPNTVLSFEKTFEILIKEGALNNKALSFTASYQEQEQSRTFEVILKRTKWDRMEAVAVILNDITYQENLIVLKVANKNKDKMIATVSHELRTPLHGIIGVLETTEKTVEDSGVLENLSLCKDHAYLLLSLVNSIVDFHQISTGKLRLNPMKMEIRKMLNHLKALFQFQCNQKRLHLELDIQKEVPAYVITDENRVKQILVNLVGNAIKFTFHGGIKIEVRADPEDQEQIEIAVADTGIGIKEEDKERLFKTFRKIAERESVGKSGVGLGLTMSNALASMLNGKKDERGIEVASEPGVGSRFFFRVLRDLRKNMDTKDQPYRSEVLEIDGGLPQKESSSETQKRNLEDVSYDNWRKSAIWDEEDKKKEKEDNISSDCYEDSGSPLDVESKLASHVCLRKGATHEMLLFSKSPQMRAKRGSRLNEHLKPHELSRDSVLEPSSDVLLKFDGNKQFKKKKKRDKVAAEVNSPDSLILVVDDYPFNLLVAKNLLKDIGYSIKTAMGGEEAIEIVKSCSKNHQPIKVILMDCQMPVMDGYETTKILIGLMEKNEVQHVPILAWTANNSEEDIQRCYESGMVGHVSKPTSQEALSKAIFKAINGAK